MTDRFKTLLNGDGDRAAVSLPDYPAPLPLTVADIPRGCHCVWWRAHGQTRYRLQRVARACSLHGWVDAPVGDLAALLGFAGTCDIPRWSTVPAALRAPIRRLRESLQRQRDSATVAAPTCDVRTLAVWLGDVHVPWVLLARLRAVDALIDWKTYPYSLEESYAITDG